MIQNSNFVTRCFHAISLGRKYTLVCIHNIIILLVNLRWANFLAGARKIQIPPLALLLTTTYNYFLDIKDIQWHEYFWLGCVVVFDVLCYL